MPRKNLARRFEPRGGVSQTALDAECRYVGRELEDYLLWSINELREKLAGRQNQIATAESELQERLSGMPDRQRLALRCMLARDFLHIGLLYCTFLKSSPEMDDATGPATPAAKELDKNEEPLAVLPFKETLFG